MSLFDDIGTGFSSLGNMAANLYTFGGYGASQQAQAAQSIGEAQLAQQQWQQQQALQYAQATPQDLQAMQSQLQLMAQFGQLTQANIQGQMSLSGLSNQQAIALLNGESAPVMAPYQKMMGIQQSQMSNSLASQLGSGWAASTAGQQAIQNFDLGAAFQGSQLQSQYTGQVAQLGSQAIGAASSQAQTLSGLNQGAYGMSTGLQQLLIGALQGNSTTQYQGAGSLGQYTLGQFGSNQGSAVLSGLTSAAGAYAGGSGRSSSGASTGIDESSIPSASNFSYTGALGTFK